ncbi:MAG: hypothetical protein AB7G12_15900 [Thermoanaerobaculia bacterium]
MRSGIRAGRAAHFLDSGELADSPPNDALVRTYFEAGLDVDLYAPAGSRILHSYGESASTHTAEFGFRWLARNALRPGWGRYAIFSATAEDPLAVAGCLARAHRRPFIALVDEIKTGSYSGNRTARWKRLCQWAIRTADLRIVNDEVRIELLRQYADLTPAARTLVYPGGYVNPPAACDRTAQRQAWSVTEDAVVIGFSGGFNLTAGVHWLLDTVRLRESLHAVVQPLGIDDLVRDLLSRLEPRDRFHFSEKRLTWAEAWSQAAAIDIGVAVYLNEAPQFQAMGVSSNRLCMFLAMGVPVITSVQDSFRFVLDYDCGRMVRNQEEFLAAVDEISVRREAMSANARRCWNEYVATERRYSELAGAVRALLK